MDALYEGTDKNDPLSANEFPQKSTSAKFVKNAKLEVTFKPQATKSSHCKRVFKIEKDAKQNEAKRLKLAGELELKREVDEKLGRSYSCALCGLNFSTEEGLLEDHACEIPSTEEEEQLGIETSLESEVQPRDIFAKDDTIFEVPERVVRDLSKVPMCGGITLHKGITAMGDGVKDIIKAEVGKGMKQASNRQSILEMKETIDRIIPYFMRRELKDIQNCVSGILNAPKKAPLKPPEKSPNDASGDAPNNIKVPKKCMNKTEHEKRQEDAGTLKRTQSVFRNNPDKGYVFLAKYINICLIDKDSKPRIITDIKFDNTPSKMKWFVEATLARRHQYDDRLLVLETSTTDVINIEINTALSKCIKTYKVR